MVYIYKNNITDSYNLFLANLMPGRAVISKDGKTLEVARSQDGHFYINAKLNGVNVKFLIDTGASSISISKSIAQKIGIDVAHLDYNRLYKTANGNMMAATASLQSFQIGDVIMQGLPVSISAADNSEMPLLGMSFLGKLQSYTFSHNIAYLQFR